MSMNINEDLVFTGFILRDQALDKSYDSKDWNLYRVSSNDRYTETLTPTFEDKVVHVPGQKGSYYFGTKYKDKAFSINVAFDNLSIDQFKDMTATFENLVMQEEPMPLQLIFDDTPYKMNLVYLQNPPSLSYVPFDENGETILKGEGTINFICFEPFARSTEYRYTRAGENIWKLLNYQQFMNSQSSGLYIPFTHRLQQWNDGITASNLIVNFGDYSISPIIKIYNSIISFKNDESSKEIAILCSNKYFGVNSKGKIKSEANIVNYFKIDFPRGAEYIIIDCNNSRAYDDSFNNLEIKYDYDNYAQQASCNIVIPSGYIEIIQACEKEENPVNPRNRSFLFSKEEKFNFDCVYGIYIEGISYSDVDDGEIELIYDYLYM